MAKQISFGESDKELLKKINNHQKENNIKSFVEAVRKL